jgi:MarR family
VAISLARDHLLQGERPVANGWDGPRPGRWCWLARFMAMLSEQPTRTLGMSQLAAVTSASLSRLSNVVKRLERRGYLRRQTDPSDGRCAAARHFVIDAVTPARLRQLRAADDKILSRIDPQATTRPPEIGSGRPPRPVRARPGS